MAPRETGALRPRVRGVPDRERVFSDSSVFTDRPTDAGRSSSTFSDSPLADRAASAAGIDLQLLLRRNVVSGHSLAFRAPARQIVLPFSSRLYHDAWIVVLLAATGRLMVIDQPLVWHRQHETNLVGPRRVLSLATALSSLQRSQQELTRLASGYREVSERLAGMEAQPDSVGRAAALVAEKVAHLELRASLDRRRLIASARSCASPSQRLSPVLSLVNSRGERIPSACAAGGLVAAGRRATRRDTQRDEMSVTAMNGRARRSVPDVVRLTNVHSDR